MGFLGGSDGKESACNAGDLHPLEKGMATHSSVLAWIPWTEEPGRLYSPWCHKESDMTERLTLSLSLFNNNNMKHSDSADYLLSTAQRTTCTLIDIIFTRSGEARSLHQEKSSPLPKVTQLVRKPELKHNHPDTAIHRRQSLVFKNYTNCYLSFIVLKFSMQKFFIRRVYQ